VKDERSRPQIPEVEELSDLQWARIERGLWQRMDTAPLASTEATEATAAARVLSSRSRGARLWRVVALGGALAAAAMLLFALWPGDEKGAGERGLVAERSDEPSRVVTRDSATTVSFADTAIEVQPNSALLMSGNAERGATIVLEHGRAGFHVAPRLARQPFVVVAGNALVRVVGTHFEVARSGEDVTVEVQEGVVDVRYLGQVHQVMAGGEWHSPPVKAVQQTLLDGAGSGEAPVAADAPRVPADPATRPRRGLPKDAPAVSPTMSKAPTSAQTTAPSAEFAAAAQLESVAPQRAMLRYLELSQRDDRWGRNALFAAARLALDLGDRARAAQLARSYLRRFPDGPNAPDARALLDALP
jgi:ferric-dicitrate binding protein FerR (iron transport regulator)